VSWIDERDGNTEVYYKRSIDNGNQWSPDSRLTVNSSRSTDPSLAITGSNVHVIWTDARDNNQIYTGNYEIYYKRNPFGNTENIYVNIMVMPEGFYDSWSNHLNMKDTVTAYLRSSTSPFAVVDFAKSTVDPVALCGNYFFNTAPSGTYYIVMKHRNSLESWSKSGGEQLTAGGSFSYNFSNAIAQTFGSNAKQIDNSPVRFGMFSGDVNQDGSVELTDLINVFNDANNYVSGYVPD
jgi:hypothetical protein